MKHLILPFICLQLLTSQMFAQPNKSDYMKIIQGAAEYNWEENENIINRWKSNIKKSNLFGYSTTSYPANFAELLGFMYQETGDEKYVKKSPPRISLSEEGISEF